MKSTRTSIKKLRNTTDKAEAEALLKKVSGMLDKLAKTNVIHKNKAANDKSKLTKYVNSL
jgi:small subunit ribosomal protein S20